MKEQVSYQLQKRKYIDSNNQWIGDWEFEVDLYDGCLKRIGYSSLEGIQDYINHIFLPNNPQVPYRIVKVTTIEEVLE